MVSYGLLWLLMVRYACVWFAHWQGGAEISETPCPLLGPGHAVGRRDVVLRALGFRLDIGDDGQGLGGKRLAGRIAASESRVQVQVQRLEILEVLLQEDQEALGPVILRGRQLGLDFVEQGHLGAA